MYKIPLMYYITYYIVVWKYQITKNDQYQLSFQIKMMDTLLFEGLFLSIK